MFDKSDVKEEHIQEAYKLLKEYCDKNNYDLLTFVAEKGNIKSASEYIHKQLNFALRLILKPAKIEKMILDNHDWILAKAKEYHKQS